MEEENSKNSTNKPIDSDAQSKIILGLRQQQKNLKQPAQDRLKRLQASLKPLKDKKVDKERGVQKRITKNSSSAINNSVSSTATAISFVINKAQNPVNRTKVQLSEQTPSSCVTVTNTWAKPKALLDASNRLEKRPISANQRLAKLRESLQQQTQTHPLPLQKQPVSLHKQVPTPAQTQPLPLQKQNQTPTQTQPLSLSQKQTDPNNNCDKTDTAIKELPDVTATNDVEEIALPSPKSDAEPMDIDCQDEEQEEQQDVKEEDDNCTALDLSMNKNRTQPENKSDLTLQRLLATGQELPARCLDYMYFVLDTNVLLHNIDFVEALCHVALGETTGSMLYIPYIVIKELDKLKDRRNDNDLTRSRAIRVIHYLNKKFDDSLKIQGQSALEEADHLIKVDCPDDSIVNCCLQLQSQVPHLMLLTNDNNLRLKANASAINVSCSADLIKDYRSHFGTLSNPI